MKSVVLQFLAISIVLGCGADAVPDRGTALVPPASDSAAGRGAHERRSRLPGQPIIVIDPGHPSETGGGTVQHGVAEVHVAWLVGIRLRDLLRAQGYRVILTKSREDERVRNADRAAIANRAGAALMVRLHCDATAGSGFTLYYPNRRGTVNGVTGPSDTVMRRSRAAADSLHAGMAGVLTGRLRDGGIKGDSETAVGGRQGALTGSIYSRVPVVTIEMVVLGARSDAEFIASAEGQALMSRAIAAGVGRFVPIGPATPRQDSVARSSGRPPADSSGSRDTARSARP